MSKIVLNNRVNFPLKLLMCFKPIAVFVVGSFLLPHPVEQPSLDIFYIPVQLLLLKLQPDRHSRQDGVDVLSWQLIMKSKGSWYTWTLFNDDK